MSVEYTINPQLYNNSYTLLKENLILYEISMK